LRPDARAAAELERRYQGGRPSSSTAALPSRLVDLGVALQRPPRCDRGARPTSADTLTVLRAVDGAIMTKRIRRDHGDELLPTAYDRGLWFAVEELPVAGLIDLGQLLASIECDPHACVVRGTPLPGIDRCRCRRLLHDRIDQDGSPVAATFGPSAPRWLALDFDGLPTPSWNQDHLTARRLAIARGRADHGIPRSKSEGDGENIDFAGDGDPAPIDPVADWALVCRAAISTLPLQFHNVSAWWHMTSSAGTKPGIRLRLWFWLDRPVTDDEAKRWLADAPVDRSLYSPAQVHYVARPIFDPPELDPVPLRSGWFWSHSNVVPVPALPEPEAVNLDHLAGRSWTAPAHATPTRRALRYADAGLRAIARASPGTRHPTLLAVGVRLYSLADAGLLDPAHVTQQLLAAAETPLSAPERRQRCVRIGGRPSVNEQAIDWARARARAAPDLPEGFGRSWRALPWTFLPPAASASRSRPAPGSGAPRSSTTTSGRQDQWVRRGPTACAWCLRPKWIGAALSSTSSRASWASA
jgi:hypothetical protein